MKLGVFTTVFADLAFEPMLQRAITAALADLAELGEAIGLVSIARDIREVRLPKLQEERLSIVVLGEFNHGKSTFLNALLGQPLLPVGATPTTGALCQLQQGDAFAAEAVFSSGQRQPVPQAELDGWHSAHPGPISDPRAYRDFLRRIGYLVPVPKGTKITTANVDDELARQDLGCN